MPRRDTPAISLPDTRERWNAVSYLRKRRRPVHRVERVEAVGDNEPCAVSRLVWHSCPQSHMSHSSSGYRNPKLPHLSIDLLQLLILFYPTWYQVGYHTVVVVPL